MGLFGRLLLLAGLLAVFTLVQCKKEVSELKKDVSLSLEICIGSLWTWQVSCV